MYIAKFERLHSTSELVLSIANNWCAKHNQEPQFCGATKEAREIAGDVLKVGGVLLCVVALIKALK